MVEANRQHKSLVEIPLHLRTPAGDGKVYISQTIEQLSLLARTIPGFIIRLSPTDNLCCCCAASRLPLGFTSQDRPYANEYTYCPSLQLMYFFNHFG